MRNRATREEVEAEFELGNLDDEYAEYLMNNCGGHRIICNGDTLLRAMEDGYMSDSFIDGYVDFAE